MKSSLSWQLHLVRNLSTCSQNFGKTSSYQVKLSSKKNLSSFHMRSTSLLTASGGSCCQWPEFYGIHYVMKMFMLCTYYSRRQNGIYLHAFSGPATAAQEHIRLTGEGEMRKSMYYAPSWHTVDAGCYTPLTVKCIIISMRVSPQAHALNNHT